MWVALRHEGGWRVGRLAAVHRELDEVFPPGRRISRLGVVQLNIGLASNAAGLSAWEEEFVKRCEVEDRVEACSEIFSSCALTSGPRTVIKSLLPCVCLYRWLLHPRIPRPHQAPKTDFNYISTRFQPDFNLKRFTCGGCTLQRSHTRKQTGDFRPHNAHLLCNR